jgi:phage terminase large subunit-like protein
MIRLNPLLASAVRIMETAKTLACPELGTRYRALSAEANTAFGLSPSFIIHDELGLVRGPRAPLYEALESAVGANADPLSIVISTQAASDSDFMSVITDDALGGHDPTTIVRLFTAPPELDAFDEQTIKLANPAYGTLLSSREVLAQAADARRMPAREASFRNLVLNQRCEASAPFVSPSVWAGCGGQPINITGRTVFAGLDLSSVNDLTALVLAHCDLDGIWHVRPFFWLPSENLSEKSRADRVPYDEWRDRGLLETTPGASVQYEHVAQRIREIFDDYQVLKIAYDPWGFTHLKPELQRAGFSEHMIEQTFAEFRQGTVSMTPALRALEGLLLDKKIRHGGNPILSMCFANAVIEGDATARKLSKKRSSGRIDGAVALTMAIGVAPAAFKVKFDAAALIG